MIWPLARLFTVTVLPALLLILRPDARDTRPGSSDGSIRPALFTVMPVPVRDTELTASTTPG